MTIKNPYQNLPEKAFWKPSISNRDHTEITDLYEKKFEISQNDRLVSAGSCFAQHIARHLRENGYNYCDYEPAPKYFPLSKQSQFNYGTYSARFCNIYTVRQLRQTFERAFGLREFDNAVWEKDGGVVDPFRPLVEPKPFIDIEEMRASRLSHYTSVKKVFSECDVFIFTLGLTETWEDTNTGDVFPLCPGTQGGDFDPAIHQFKNLTYKEIVGDLIFIIGEMKKLNPNVKFLFTVSPVPLVATASGKHVLPATVYSKSVLRAAIGTVCDVLNYADYFPSYEIVSAHPFKSSFYERNMRGVTAFGVDFVMKHFFSQHPVLQVEKEIEQVDLAVQQARQDEIVCEEMLLDQEARW